VQEGNTLSSLAERYGSDVDTLMLVNCLNTDTIFLGQRLYVPGILTPVLPATPLLGTPTSAGRATVEPLPTGVRATPSGPLPKANIPNIYLNIVLLGSDRRPDSGAWRTDSMIVVSVDQRNQEVRLLSLPRDLWVYIPNHGYNRINTADLWGELAHEGDGPEWVKRTIYENLGIPIHYYVRVDFNGFIKIIDSLGGVDINVEEALPDVRIEAGPQHMNGKEALRYARSRYTTSDFDRGRRQRILLTALWEQALTLDVVPRLPQLWVSMADTFMTDLPLSEVINLAYLGTKVKREDIHSAGFDRAMVENWTTPEGAAVLLPREERIQAMLEDFYAPLPAAQVATDNPVIVEVLNGCQGEEAEEMAASRLRAEGYKVNRTGSAGRQDYPQTSIVVYKGELAIGQAIAGVLGVPATAATQASDSDEQPDVRVILGADYGQCQP
jgi:LCP family protein required for cell wall assembly